MAEYQVLARRYRPQTFAEVFGQVAIVTTLKNAILHKRLAHAYLFCGSRGTGKTTLARVFAKALNCQTVRDDLEPCNRCSSCLEIASGSSLDVLEIDGASHRGIDDIRQINETVGYASAAGGYKIYIIDEVHMLTKEAFNALLKTLEEPPAHVKFFFATTEPHKVPTTILSRCQRFNLNRIPLEMIQKKLTFIAEQQQAEISVEALRIIASRAEGGMRDAESLLDQILAFHDGKITAESVADVLGIVPRELFFALDRGVQQSNLAIAFELVHQIFSQGKDLIHFVESLTEHFRTVLLVKIADQNAPFLNLSASDSIKYAQSAKIYSQEQCLTILDFLVEALGQIRFMPSGRIALEALLLRILRIQQRVPVDFLVQQLTELEQAIGKMAHASPANLSTLSESVAMQMPTPARPEPTPAPTPTTIPTPTFTQAESPPVPIQPTPSPEQPEPTPAPAQPEPPPAPTRPEPEPEPEPEPSRPEPTPAPANPEPQPPAPQAPGSTIQNVSITTDPSPTLQELGIEVFPPEVTKQDFQLPPPNTIGHAITAPAPIELGARPTQEAQMAASKKQSRYDTILQFAAVELEGSLQKTAIKGF